MTIFILALMTLSTCVMAATTFRQPLLVVLVLVITFGAYIARRQVRDVLLAFSLMWISITVMLWQFSR